MFGAFIEKLMPSETCEIRVAMLGPRRAGKTSMLTAMYERFENALLAEKVSDCISLTADADTEKILTKNYEELRRLIREGGSIAEAITGDSESKKYGFSLKRSARDERVQIRLTFQDYPGGWLMAGSHDPSSDEYKQVMSYVKDAHVLLIAVDAPYLMEESGKYHERRNMPHLIFKTVEAAWSKTDNTPRMVMLVPIKCEKYDKAGASRKIMVEAVRNGYKELVDYLMDMPRCAVICAPAQTTGCVKFDHFEAVESPDEIPAPVFSMPEDIEHRQYVPRDCSQTLRFCLVYAIQRFVKDNSEGFVGVIKQFFKLDQDFVDAADRLVCGCKGEFFRTMTKK